MNSFSIYTLPHLAPEEPAFQEYSRRLKDLRLKSLQADPDSWISVYESEVDQPPEFWWNRLKDSKAVHHILVRDSTGPDPADTESALLRGEWLGFVVIIVPDPHQEQPEYEMSALYIDTRVRGHGLGKRMVEKVIEEVKRHESQTSGKQLCCATTVRHGNESALKLYEKLGFRVIDADSVVEKEGRRYHATEMRLDV